MFQQQEAWGVYRQEMAGKKGNISNRMCSKKNMSKIILGCSPLELGK